MDGGDFNARSRIKDRAMFKSRDLWETPAGPKECLDKAIARKRSDGELERDDRGHAMRNKNKKGIKNLAVQDEDGGGGFYG